MCIHSTYKGSTVKAFLFHLITFEKKGQSLCYSFAPIALSVALTAKRPIPPFTPRERVPQKFAIPAFYGGKTPACYRMKRDPNGRKGGMNEGRKVDVGKDICVDMVAMDSSFAALVEGIGRKLRNANG